MAGSPRRAGRPRPDRAGATPWAHVGAAHVAAGPRLGPRRQALPAEVLPAAAGGRRAAARRRACRLRPPRERLLPVPRQRRPAPPRLPGAANDRVWPRRSAALDPARMAAARRRPRRRGHRPGTRHRTAAQAGGDADGPADRPPQLPARTLGSDRIPGPDPRHVRRRALRRRRGAVARDPAFLRRGGALDRRPQARPGARRLLREQHRRDGGRTAPPRRLRVRRHRQPRPRLRDVLDPLPAPSGVETAVARPVVRRPARRRPHPRRVGHPGRGRAPGAAPTALGLPDPR